MRDAGHRTPDAGHRTSDGEKSKNNISTPQGGGHNYNQTISHLVHTNPAPIFLVFLNLLIYGLLFRQVGTQER